MMQPGYAVFELSTETGNWDIVSANAPWINEGKTLLMSTLWFQLLVAR